jgi:SAM-dependent methyltransferase
VKPLGHRERGLDALLQEQVRYYRAVAAEYEDHALPHSGAAELIEALDAFRPAGSVLELACGQGTWTARLLRHAADITAVDASSEMLAIASARVRSERVRFESADLFHWRPDRRYDVVFFGFWLSHVPPERFESFWSLVAECLKPDGRVFFVDDGYRTADELIEGERSATIQRRLNDGTAYRIVKVPYRPADLERDLERIGWSITVHPTSGPFFWGAGARAHRAPY